MYQAKFLNRAGRACRVALHESKTRFIHASAPRFNSVTVNVNGKDIEVPQGATVLHACEEAGVDIPRFCYHDRLSIAGNCRMCLVEVEKSAKPVASCAMPLMPGMKIKTDTPLVHKAREGVMEFLLANHPLDCPICDQGGECDLQDQSMAFGGDRSRFFMTKRGVEDKNIGPLIQTIMTRCIHCTRCVRFSSEVAGTPVLGTTGRGNGMEIGTYVEDTFFDSEMSGNVIDLCPVGALTSKPYAFRARPWELLGTESIDVTDAVGASIRVDARNNEVMRITPRLNEAVNEEWISDKARFSYDGLKTQRLDTPMMKINGKLQPCTWPEAFDAIKAALEKTNPSDCLAMAGDLADAESLMLLKDLMNKMGAENFAWEDELDLRYDLRSEYLFNSTIEGIEESDSVLLVGTNPRMEAPLVNTRIRKCVIQNDLEVASIGPSMDLTYDIEDLGNDAKVLSALIDGSHPYAQTLKEAQKPLIILGLGALKDASIYATIEKLKSIYPNLCTEDWNGVSILQIGAGRTAALDIGFATPALEGKQSPAKFAYLLNAEPEKPKMIDNGTFVVYQGHHGDKGAMMADVVLPGAAYTEKRATYVNTEGRPQETNAAVDMPQRAREDWKIIRALSEVLGYGLPYNSVADVQARLAEVSPTFNLKGEVSSPIFTKSGADKTSSAAISKFEPFVQNFYLTNPISRSSTIMAQCTRMLKKSTSSYM
mmetsp:Transcript_6500/g.8992  ORF Transcript_6500/g.8992 Transcript_6500/m.8992 type:complete len:710 (-) Transcript_6500:330-2459(-)|eukprot:CAMPEP_0184478148 /NCGR_PEP_ID=MMETSP0113_2-20130426/255_1 /TAXON_ID=91329 /ORGANISM="Norrisiella sphaerica, Strain BC52" /LENGTH=709 /DNA_ID=CAMNT_0026855837 /DNA_START=134 /DNA_END=2263 /DNA_ORIENTATION=+